MTAKIEITDEVRSIIRRAAGMGFTWDKLEKLTKINKRTLQRHCQNDYDSGSVELEYGISMTLAEKALDGNVTAGIYIDKTRFGWKETSKTELTGENGGPIVSEAKTTTQLSPEQIAALVRALDKEF